MVLAETEIRTDPHPVEDGALAAVEIRDLSDIRLVILGLDHLRPYQDVVAFELDGRPWVELGQPPGDRQTVRKGDRLPGGTQGQLDLVNAHRDVSAGRA